MTCKQSLLSYISLQIETENVLDRSNNISVSIELQNVMDRYRTDQKAIRYNGNIVLIFTAILLSRFDKTLLMYFVGLKFFNVVVELPG